MSSPVQCDRPVCQIVAERKARQQGMSNRLASQKVKESDNEREVSL